MVLHVLAHSRGIQNGRNAQRSQVRCLANA